MENPGKPQRRSKYPVAVYGIPKTGISGLPNNGLEMKVAISVEKGVKFLTRTILFKKSSIKPRIGYR